tara:strand:+ start:422 stop:631 length:210 start_codon:yes stop_codon:yes gene_type:complete
MLRQLARYYLYVKLREVHYQDQILENQQIVNLIDKKLLIKVLLNKISYFNVNYIIPGTVLYKVAKLKKS